jgi:hypothetical protein
VCVQHVEVARRALAGCQHPPRIGAPRVRAR